MEHFVRMYQYYESYGQLLTAKQQQAMELYFGHDLSLAEIAQEMGSSRQAVHDLLKRSEQTLKMYEEQLGLVAAHRKREERFLVLGQLLQELADEDDVRWSAVLRLLDELRE